MLKSNLQTKMEALLGSFVVQLQNSFGDNLVSVILYGSAASGEFMHRASNINLLVVLKNDDVQTLRPAAPALNRYAFRMFHPIFLSEAYIRTSVDTFPIEFLDMQENYRLMHGRDVLAGLTVEKTNLRFQCEYELKTRLIRLKTEYFLLQRNKAALESLLVNVYTSVVHLARNVVRLLGAEPAYKKKEFIKQAHLSLGIDAQVWQRIQDFKERRGKITRDELDTCLTAFAQDLQKLVRSVDTL